MRLCTTSQRNKSEHLAIRTLRTSISTQHPTPPRPNVFRAFSLADGDSVADGDFLYVVRLLRRVVLLFPVSGPGAGDMAGGEPAPRQLGLGASALTDRGSAGEQYYRCREKHVEVPPRSCRGIIVVKTRKIHQQQLL